MAASASVSHTISPTFSSKLSLSSSISTHPAFDFSKSKVSTLSFGLKLKSLTTHTHVVAARFPSSILRASASPSPSLTPTPSSSAAANSTTFHGLCYVVGDKIDTDQIIPAEYLTLVPSNPDEYEKLGSYAFTGLSSSYRTPFIEPNQKKSKYSIVIAGSNFGFGSSRELAPVALRASGVASVVAESYARVFFRNSMASRGIYPLESEVRLCEECKTGDVVTVELGERLLVNHTTGKKYKLKPIGDAGHVVETGGGGNLACGRQSGLMMMIPPHWVHIIVGSVSYLVMVTTLLLAGQRNVTVNNILQEQRQSLPKTTSIEGQNKLAISLFNFKGNVSQ